MTDQPPIPSPAGTVRSFTPSTAVVLLSMLIAVLALVATTMGLFSGGGDGERTFVTVRGETADIFGKGLYQHDSIFRAAGNKGSDAVTLVLAIPVLLVGVLVYSRGSLRGGLVLGGALTWFLYLYASLSVGTAFNELFLVYVALFSASLYGLVLALRSLDLARFDASPAPIPVRYVAGLLVASGLVTIAVWSGPLLAALINGEPPGLLDHSMTMVTEALDLAIITPATFLAAWLLWRGRLSQGLQLAVPLLALLIALLPVIVAQTIFQANAGVEFETAEIVGPISGFLVLGVIAGFLLFRILRVVGRAVEP